ncbi:MAG: cytochrome c3 family protein [Deltaproteobacteria bacterium]|jgi:hypothetical protein|nr:cytochrome c3 family protein [Deltaproteobacteria bacterium]
MEEKRNKAAGIGGLISAAVLPFIIGLILALVIGWWAFPLVLFKEVPQPVAFKHSPHSEVMECADCHFLREDGSFSGIPTTAECASCHESAQGESRAEAEYIEKYVNGEQEAPWLVHQKQPDNAFFSHAAHSLESCQQMGCHADYEKAEDLCITCHPSTADLDKPVPYLENRLTGYSNSTMKMWECERCHANPNHLDMTNANNACYTCHK